MSRGESSEGVIAETTPGSLKDCSPLVQCDGQQLKDLIQAGMGWLEQHKATVNALNVFPVPDGDTGTNMYLTMQAAWQEISGRQETSVNPIAQAIAHGALMGARGNSGVILSQLFRGMAQALEDCDILDAAAFARALQQASATAYKAVIRPVEGTILTVARRAAEAGTAAADEVRSLQDMFSRIVNAAGDAVADTPSLLPVLAEAGVVDAGGQGLYLILEGMLRSMRGERVVRETMAEELVELTHLESPEVGYGYDVQFLLQGEALDVERIRADIDAMGDSTLVVGGSQTIKVHVHTPNPGDPLNYAALLGSLSNIIVENMQEQYEDFLKSSPTAPQASKTTIATKVAVIAVVPGAGLAKVFESLGTSVIVPGGQTMNPSTEDLLKAISDVSTEEIIILPNNKNVVLTAEQAMKISDRRVGVVPSKTIPQGISALLAYNYQADLDSNLDTMTESLGAIRTGEVTRAIRSVKIDGVKVKKDQIIGLLDGKLIVAGDEYSPVILKLLQEMQAQDLEIITIYFGEETNQTESQALADMISMHYPDQEVEVVEGGQPHYPFILSAE